ncbi:MAG: LysM peptidoglycan-binding domain-containing protein [Chitinophagales bacterium]|nr:LysM peptidoglycan-binding domain-containing protein [Chitinophagales bacterium]MDW8427311.1 LysM peptidoglycan-binding domain-containing protein [Chitinophagales bacterium]
MPFFRFLTLTLISATLATGQQLKLGKQQSLTTDRHVVSEGETLYSIARRYHTSVQELLRLNPDLSRQTLRAGMTITVPLMPSRPQPSNQMVFHRVEKGETLYSIARKYGEKVDSLISWNKLKSSNLREGQQLVVGFIAPIPPMGPWTPEQEDQMRRLEQIHHPAEEGAKSAQKQKATSEKSPQHDQFEREKVSHKAHREQGIAVWSYSDYDDGNFYALHPTAPKGTEVVVTNPMNGRSVVVRVIGKLPQVQGNSDVIIRISQSAARQLNVLDERFIAHISYRIPSPDQ